jgi:hypothetical protein
MAGVLVVTGGSLPSVIGSMCPVTECRRIGGYRTVHSVLTVSDRQLLMTGVLSI